MMDALAVVPPMSNVMTLSDFQTLAEVIGPDHARRWA